jgi:hypothetical protein
MASDARYSVNIQLCSWCSKFRAQVMCFILPKVIGNVPALYIENDSWKLNLQICSMRIQGSSSRRCVYVHQSRTILSFTLSS